MLDTINLKRAELLLRRYKIPFLPRILKRLNFYHNHSIVHCSVKFGKGTRLAYGGSGVLIVAGTVIGENCVIGVNSAIIRKCPYKNVPIIGNNVYLGPGAIIVGPVIIEDNVIIAANSVVTKSVRKNSIVAGVPAVVIGDTSKSEYNILENPKFKDGTMDYL